MSDSLKHDKRGEWVEISDGQGKKIIMRHLGTVQCGGKNYFVLGAIKNAPNQELSEGGIMLVREERTQDGAREYILTHDEDEIERVFDHFMMDEIMQDLLLEEDWDEEVLFDEDAGTALICDEAHTPWTLCVCGQPDFLQ